MSAQAVVAQPFMVGSIGLLTVFVAPVAVVILAITLILIPVALAAVILLVLAWLFGVVALGMVVGDRMTQASHRDMEPVFSAGLGTLVLAIVVSTAQHVPCVGWIAPALVGLVGLGAAVITMFGTRPMHQNRLQPPRHACRPIGPHATGLPRPTASAPARGRGAAGKRPGAACYNDLASENLPRRVCFYYWEGLCSQEWTYPTHPFTMPHPH